MSTSRRDFIKRGILVAGGLALLDAFWIEKFFIEINEFYTGSAVKNVQNIKVIQVSDLHLQSVNYQLTRLASKINTLDPDLILITGDAIDKAKNITELDKFLSLINKNIDKVAILGNWEYWGNVDLAELEKVYTTHNCRLLKNQTTLYSIRNKTISITGLDDYLGGNSDILQALENYKKSDHHIILNHCPQYNDIISSKKSPDIPVDFILSGHTHGGQINIFGFIPFLPQGSGKYIKGWYDGSPKVYVSKGIGTSILPARFGARAEIAIFNL